MTLHKIAIALGAELAPAYEIDGETQAATYTLTLAQLEAVVVEHAAIVLTEQAQRFLAVPLKGRIGDWHDAQLDAQSLIGSAAVLRSSGCSI